MPRAGEYRVRAAVRKMVEAEDGAGGYTDEPVVVCRPWIALEPEGGRKHEWARQVDPRVTLLARTRYRRDGAITARRQLVVGSRVLEILSVIDVEERHRELHILCKEAKA